MAATAELQECNGAVPGTWTTITDAKFCTADNPNPGTQYPIPIVKGQTKRSFWKSLALRFSGTYTEIANVAIYGDGVEFGTGMTIYIGDQTLADAGYAPATGTTGDTGDEMITGHPGITSKTLFSTYTSTSPKAVDAGPISGTTRSKHAVLQLDVAETASPGGKGPKSCAWRYDEV